VKNPVKMTVTRFSGTSVFAKLLLYWTDKVTKICSREQKGRELPFQKYGRTLHATISSWSIGL
jgi:hypothetical protein